MTTYIFFENATGFDYDITDQDGHKFGKIVANGYYGLKLNYSPTFEKKYVLTGGNGFFTIWLSMDGQISKIYPNSSVHLEVRPEEYTTRTQIFPPPIKTYDRVSACCHMYGPAHNKLLITPLGNIYARVIPMLAPPVPDRALRLDFV
jgi:hypothetical protein